MDVISSLPKLDTWSDITIINPHLSCIKVKKIQDSEKFFIVSKENQYNTCVDNPIWSKFTKYVRNNNIKGFKEIKNPPDQIILMINDPKWR